MAWEMEYRRVIICECDCTEVMRLFSRILLLAIYIVQSSTKVQLLLKRERQCSLKHVYRETNSVVDFMAKKLSFIVSSVWSLDLVEYTPAEVSPLLMANIGVACMRSFIFAFLFSPLHLADIPKKDKFTCYFNYFCK